MNDGKGDTGNAAKANACGDNVPVEPVTKGYWWVKRIALSVAVLLVTLVASRLWWGDYAESQLVAEIDKYRQTGQMVFPEEFDRELDAVPDEQNAAILLVEAMRFASHFRLAGVDFDAFCRNPALFEQDSAAATEIMDLNVAALDSARRARLRPDVVWNSRVRGLFALYNDPFWRPLRLAELLRFTTSYHHRLGNDAEAVETLRDLIMFGNALDSHSRAFLGCAAVPIRRIAWLLIEDISPTLHVRVFPTSQGERSSAVEREVVKGLVAELLDEEGQRQSAVRDALDACAYILVALVRSVESGAPPRGASWYEVDSLIWEPYSELCDVWMFRLCTVMAKAATAPTWPAAQHVIAGMPVRSRASELLGSFWAGSAKAQADSLERFFEGLALRRMAATALAIRLFVVDHGHRPAKLSELVPEYLPAVPMDPLSRSGTPIRYEPDAVPPVLYSTGLDGEDNGGVIAQRPDGSLNAEASDLVFHLDGRAADDEGKCSLLELLGLESAEPPP